MLPSSRSFPAFGLFLLCVLRPSAISAAPQPPPPPKVDQARVDAAIEKGVAYLRTLGPASMSQVAYVTQKGTNYRGLVLYTLAWAGVPAEDPGVKTLLEECVNAPLERTYSVACEAMALEKIDRRKYRPRLAKIGQWLVDTQCANGQWSYGAVLPEQPGVTYSAGGEGGSGSTVAEIPLKRTVRQALPYGDNSCSQYALLGLRACLEAGVVAPAQTFALAEKWWAASLIAKDGYAGWGYSSEGKVKGKATGSMTAGAIGSVAIARYGQRKDPKKSPLLNVGLLWLTPRFSVTENPAMQKEWLYYYLYALSRAGILGEIERFGNHDWYAEGADFILKDQRPDGAWLGDTLHNDVVAETCFAILFLKRATKSITYSKTTASQ